MKTKKNLLKNFKESELSVENMRRLRGGDNPPPPEDPGGGQGGK
jgi:natural product precursor